jgi:hypothetical protein
VLAQSIHDKQVLPAEMGGRTSDVLVLYELLFGVEALTELRGANWGPYSDEVLRRHLGVDLADVETIFTEQIGPSSAKRSAVTAAADAGQEPDPLLRSV